MVPIEQVLYLPVEPGLENEQFILFLHKINLSQQVVGNFKLTFELIIRRMTDKLSGINLFFCITKNAAYFILLLFLYNILLIRIICTKK